MSTGTVLSASKRDLETADGYGEDALGLRRFSALPATLTSGDGD